jgi:hypothetical protein
LFTAAGVAGPAGAQAPRAVVPTTAHDFGTVLQGEKVSHRFEIQNEGDRPLTLRRVDVSAPGMKARFRQTVPAGQKGFVIVEWPTDDLKDEVSAEVTAYFDDPGLPRTVLRLRGRVTPSIEWHPHAAVFFSVFKGESDEQTVRLMNQEDRPLTITRIEPEGQHFAARLDPVESGKVYDLVVRVLAGTPPGRYLEAVYLHTDHPTRPRLRVAVNVFVKNDVYVSPEVVDFGTVDVAQVTARRSLGSLTQTVTARKRQGTFAITSLTTDVPGLRLEQSPAGASQFFQVQVGLDAERLRPGALAGVIRIRTDSEQFPELTVRVKGELR